MEVTPLPRSQKIEPVALVAKSKVSVAQTFNGAVIFGEGDDAYLVVNVYGSDTNSTEYYFKPGDTENGLMALISCMSNFDFSLKELLEKLPFQNYVEDDIGCYASVNGIKIFKENVVSN